MKYLEVRRQWINKDNGGSIIQLFRQVEANDDLTFKMEQDEMNGFWRVELEGVVAYPSDWEWDDDTVVNYSDAKNPSSIDLVRVK